MATKKTEWKRLKSAGDKITEKDYFDQDLKAAGIFRRSEINNFSRMYRFDKLDPYNAVSSAREFVFFTKPDLHIMDGKTGKLNSELSSNPFFIELSKKYPNVIKELQLSADNSNNPFSNLLFNSKSPGSTIDVPALTATTIDTPTNVFGTSYDYRGSSEASNDNFDFSIEFEDTKFLDTYMYFRAYEEYETLKSHGLVSPLRKYITNKVLHDVIGIYKIVTGEDMETILYYAYYCGVMWKSLPRDVFSNTEFNNGLRYSIDCKAAFVEDMNPLILTDFNATTEKYRKAKTTRDSELFNIKTGKMNGERVKSAYIIQSKLNGRKTYKLKWRV